MALGFCGVWDFFDMDADDPHFYFRRFLQRRCAGWRRLTPSGHFGSRRQFCINRRVGPICWRRAMWGGMKLPSRECSLISGARYENGGDSGSGGWRSYDELPAACCCLICAGS